MKLSETGEGRIRGYLYVLRRSLESFMPASSVEDALRELESHIRERVETTEAEPDERAALEALLTSIGEPLHVARAYSGEMVIEEAVATGRLGAMLRAIWHMATSTVVGFCAALGLFIGYIVGFAFLAVALLKPLFPDRVGLLVVDGFPQSLGFFADLPPGAELTGGYWVIPGSILAGMVVLMVTQRASRRFLLWWRGRRTAQLVPSG